MPGKCIRSVNCRLWFHLRCCGLKVSILPVKVFLKVLCTNNKLRLLCSVEDNIQYFNVFSTVWIKIICAGGCEFGQLVSLDGFPFAFRAKNGELRDLHLGFQVSFVSPWLQWQNVLIPLRLNLLNVYVYLHHWRSKFVYFVRPQGVSKTIRSPITLSQAYESVWPVNTFHFQLTPCWNWNPSHVSMRLVLTCGWHLYPQGSLGATLIGPSTLTCFWVGKIGANQVWKVLRPTPYEIRRRTFLKV